MVCSACAVGDDGFEFFADLDEAGQRRALEGQQALAALGSNAQRRSLAAQPLVLGVEQAVFLEPAAEQRDGPERENPRARLFGAVEAQLDLALERHADRAILCGR